MLRFRRDMRKIGSLEIHDMLRSALHVSSKVWFFFHVSILRVILGLFEPWDFCVAPETPGPNDVETLSHATGWA